MANKIKLKQSSVSGKVPTTTDLDLGELGINTYDGKLFLKQKVGAVETIIDVTGAASGVTSVSGSAPIVSSGGVTPSISISAATTLAAGSMSAADKTKIDAVTGTNTGDETASTIKTKLGITTLSGSNTGDQTIALTGDITGSGSGSFVTTLATITDSGTGTFKKITTNSKGLVTGSVAVAQADITGLLGASSISNTMLANSAVANLSGTNTGDQVIPVASSTTPAALGTAAVGTGTTFARADHVHTLPSLATLGAQAAGSYVTVGGALGTPSSGTLTNCTFPTLNQNTTGSSGSCTGNAATATTATNQSGGTVTSYGSSSFNFSHGQNLKVGLPAANNSAGTGDAYLYLWTSEPAATWTGGGIARNMANTSGSFPRVNTNLWGQFIHFEEGGAISFQIENTSGTRYYPLTLTNGNVSSAGSISGTNITSGGNVTGSSTSCTGNAATSSDSIGNGQTWQNVTASRAVSTTYTNSTGRSIMATITCGSPGSANNTLTITVGGVSALVTLVASGSRSSGTVIIPSGNTYSVTSAVAVTNWSELR